MIWAFLGTVEVEHAEGLLDEMRDGKIFPTNAKDEVHQCQLCKLAERSWGGQLVERTPGSEAPQVTI